MSEAADLDVCDSMQREEWQVLESIYPECVSNDLSSRSVKLEINVELGSARSVVVVDDGTVSGTGESTSHDPTLLLLSSLPPILLQLILPPAYPLHASPQIISLRATYSWLPKIHDLYKALLAMWQPGEAILYNWVEHIRTAEFLSIMELEKDGTIRIPHPIPESLSALLKSHHLTALNSRFAISSCTCSVCFESRKGAQCLQLACSHIFCRGCLADFWKLFIQEGDVGKVGCPDPECVKAGREASEEEVARIVTPEELVRWKWLRTKKALESDPHVIHCPLAFCQEPVPKPQGVDEESGWSRLRTCHACGHSFCSFCRRTWHGPLSQCPSSATESFVNEYMDLEENSPKRLLIEQRYGKAYILRLVAKYEEESANAEWFKSSTTVCPGCQVNVQKSFGCNHMTCVKCGQHFCYRCGVKIIDSNPYKHFNTPGTSCWSKLFDDPTGSDDDWQPIEGFDLL